MMYNIIIVEDETPIRRGIERITDWGNYGYKVCGSFPSAEKSIEFIKFNKVDVILTDIQLIDKSGLELIKDAKKVNEHIESIILTSYEKFEYAKIAIELDVYKYLTKPLIKEKVIKTLEELKIKLDKKQAYLDIKYSINEKEKSYIISKLLDGNNIELYEQKEIPTKLPFVYIKVTNVFVNERTKELFSKIKINNLIIFNKSTLDSINVLLFFMNSYNKEQLLTFIKNLKNIFPKAIIGVSKVYVGIKNVPIALKEAITATDYHSYVNREIIFFELIENLKYIDNKYYDILKKISEVVKYFIEAKKFDELSKEVIILINTYNIIDLNVIKNIYIELLLFISSKLYYFEISGTSINLTSIIREILSSKSRLDVEDSFESYVTLLSQSISQNSKTFSKKIKIAIEYMENNYQKQLTLEDVASVVYTHPVYFSRTFKNETGENFVNYLTKLRINRAKIMLSDISLKINDVAELTGYVSPKYFAKKFKQNTNQTPSEYREKIFEK